MRTWSEDGHFILKRKHILPGWIRFFSWIYLVFILSPLLLVVYPFFDGELTFQYLGMYYRGADPWHSVPLLITTVLTFSGIVAYGLLWGKDWAISAGLIYGTLACFISLFTTIASLSSRELNISAEPFMLVAFIIALANRRHEWRNYSPEHFFRNRAQHAATDRSS